MKADSKEMQFVIGQLSGQVASLNQTVAASSNQITSTFTAHALSDEKNFSELRKQLATDKAEVSAERTKNAWYIGAAVATGTVISLLAPVVIDKITS